LNRRWRLQMPQCGGPLTNADENPLLRAFYGIAAQIPHKATRLCRAAKLPIFSRVSPEPVPHRLVTPMACSTIEGRKSAETEGATCQRANSRRRFSEPRPPKRAAVRISAWLTSLYPAGRYSFPANPPEAGKVRKRTICLWPESHLSTNVNATAWKTRAQALSLLQGSHRRSLRRTAPVKLLHL